MEQSLKDVCINIITRFINGEVSADEAMELMLQTVEVVVNTEETQHMIELIVDEDDVFHRAAITDSQGAELEAAGADIV